VVLLNNFINIFYISELRRKILFTLGILVIYRLGVHIPVVGIDVAALRQMMDQASGLGGIFSYIDLLSGGMLRECTLFALGTIPYITASIMMQMLTMAIPTLEQLMKEGEYGRKLINQYTRYLTFAVSIVQSVSVAFILERNNLVLTPGWSFRLLFILSLSVGSMFVMWLGEQISLMGLGNGSSVIIFAGIVARFPDDAFKTIYQVQQGLMNGYIALGLVILLILISAAIVFIEKGERRIPVQYTRRVVGNKVYGGQSTYFPFKLNIVGVMPVIFAGAILNIPMFFTALLAERWAVFKWLSHHFVPTAGLYNAVEFVLIIFFTFFYTAVMYNSDELAENLKKSGGFIPGIRPGKKTSEFFDFILTRINLVGAIYLAFLALMPNILRMFLQMPFYVGGTSLLIMVGVAMDIAAQIESYLIEHRYEGFLVSGRMKMRGAR
jgi:preprotein translocase subunit SecY